MKKLPSLLLLSIFFILTINIVSAISSDIFISSLTITPKNPQIGEIVKITANITNNGFAETRFSFSYELNTPKNQITKDICCLSISPNETIKLIYAFTSINKGLYEYTIKINPGWNDDNSENNKKSLQFKVS